MALFGKKEKKNEACCCGNCGVEHTANGETASTVGAAVKVLGSGCKKCNELEANTQAALMQLGMDPAIDHVRDFTQIAGYGVMSTPALVVNGKVVSMGKVLKTEEIVAILQKG